MCTTTYATLLLQRIFILQGQLLHTHCVYMVCDDGSPLTIGILVTTILPNQSYNIINIENIRVNRNPQPAYFQRMHMRSQWNSIHKYISQIRKQKHVWICIFDSKYIWSWFFFFFVFPNWVINHLYWVFSVHTVHVQRIYSLWWFFGFIAKCNTHL